MGLRKNEPAKGIWFVPGGTVFKNERRTDAVHRVAKEELGTEVVIVDRLGTFAHFYKSAGDKGVDSKHYLSTAFLCKFRQEDPHLELDSQHDALEPFEEPTKNVHLSIHGLHPLDHRDEQRVHH